MAQPTVPRVPKVYTFGCLGIIALIAVLALIGGRGPRRSLGTGAQGVLRTESGGAIPVAVDEGSLSEATSAAVAGDQVAWTELISSHRIFLVTQGTRVLVIDRGFGTRRVRILDGPRQGMAGWVPADLVQAE